MTIAPKIGFWLRRHLYKNSLWLLALVFASTAIVAISDSNTSVIPPNIPAISLSAEPLYAKGSPDKPTMTLALSVEFPTVGAQYLSDYAQTTEYLGYFDANSCYIYNNAPAVVSGYATADLKRFDRTGAATNHGCAGSGFSGNFMNWATSSAIDVLRLGLTGGDRIVDTADLTVVQRAVLKNGSFYNDSNFPAKTLTAALANDAVPTALRGSYTGDIKIANCLNRVHFGTESTGNCGAPGNNSDLGTTSTQPPAPSGKTSGTTYITGFLSGLPTACASENGTCSFSGNVTKYIVYGASNGWAYRSYTGTSTGATNISCSNSVFGDPYTGVPKNCYLLDAAPTPITSATGALTSDNFFYTRVKVCESNSGTLLETRRYNNEDYCLKYPNGNFKPVGNLQKYSDRLRVAAFGYLMDSTTARYGGVLRAPMKYVGPKSYDINGVLVSGSNPKIEWNESTGVFIANPEGASEGKSGVINYLNQFGRTGSVQGNYKGYDPLSELYYEAVRYLQGLDPTPAATANITADMKDGFPVYDKGSSGLTMAWTDPHAGGSNTKDYSCLKNNIVVVGDVDTHYDKSVPGNSIDNSGDFRRDPSLANNEPNFRDWTHVVGGFEAKSSVTYIDGKGVPDRNTNVANPKDINTNSIYPNLQDANPPKGDNASYLMAGIAYWANTHDIRGTNWTTNIAAQRPGMRVTTYALDVNEYNDSGNSLTYRRNNQLYLAAKYGGFKDNSPNSMGNPFLNSDGAVDNSGWETYPGSNLANKYFLSSSAADVLLALRNIFEDIVQKGNSIASAATSTQNLSPATSAYAYQAQFDAADWSGDLVALAITVDSSTNAVTVADGTTLAAQWHAATQLDSRIAIDPTASTRKIFIGKVTPDISGTATEFKTLSALESDLQTALSKATPTATADTLAQDRINFLRGNRSLEGTTFRTRGHLLGDIINSGIAYSGAPSSTIDSTAAYVTFYNAYKNRKKAVFVGANDGMLHAFNADDGEELFAYIPSWLGPKLPALTNATYNSGNHQSFMDGSPAVSEALLDSGWKTVLVAGTGGGGQGVVALDVTDPDNFGAGKVIWEFSDKDDADMGNVVGKPQILKFRTSAPNTTPVYKWFAVIPSGVNNYVDDGHMSTTGRPALFLLDLSKAGTAPWILGTNYYKISLHYDGETSSTPTSTIPTGLVNFAVTGGANDEVALIYAGDLQGNVWKMDFSLLGFQSWTTSSTTPSTQTALDLLSAYTYSSKAIPLFIAKDGTGSTAKVQPITIAPTLVRGPNGGVIVVFGTGKYMESSDNVVTTSTQVQSIYAVLDNGDDDGKDATSVIPSKGRLSAGSVGSDGTTLLTPSFAWGRPLTDGDTTQRAGWYFNLPNAGERQISTIKQFGYSLNFDSTIPPDAATNACGSGTGYNYTTDIATGNGSRTVSQVGLLGEPFVLEAGSSVTVSDSTGRRVKTTVGQVILRGSTGLKVVGTQPTYTTIVGRLSWRQINNYQDLKNAP